MPTRAPSFLPRGRRDFALQLGIWFGFIAAYQVARGIADRGTDVEAFANARTVMDVERALHLFVELDVQRVVLQLGGPFVHVLNWTYWLAQFAVVGLALLWIYLFRTDSFLRVRNWILATNLLALVGYVLVPTAPPRMFASFGFSDTLATEAALNHGSGLVVLASNQYAAMPSVHAADALVIGFAMAMLVRSRLAKAAWTCWPSWVWFSVVATGNHFWLDIAGGVAVALAAGTMVAWVEARRTDDLAPAVHASRRW